MNETERAIQILTDTLNTITGPLETEEECEAIRAGIAALRSQAERENPKPLTLDELKERVGKPVWCVTLCEDDIEHTGVKGEWGIAYDDCVLTRHYDFQFCVYEKFWNAYVTEPKESEK